MSEYQEQAALVKWFRFQYPVYSSCIRLSLNGLNLPRRVAPIVINQCKAQGMVKGESDLFFAVPNELYGGIFIEMKAPKKKPSDAQADYLRDMSKLGYAAVCCQGFDEARGVLGVYMQTARTPDIEKLSAFQRSQLAAKVTLCL